MKISNLSKLFFIFLCITSLTRAQEVKFGKVSKEELQELQYEKDSSAAAAVIYRKMITRYVYIKDEGFHVITDVHERVKIYDKNGFDYGTITVKLYRDNSTREKFGSLKAVTYNLKEGEIVKTKLKKSDTFSESLSKYYDQEKFTMPNLEEGSVIEYEYTIDSPFYSSIDEIALQYDIPIKQQQIQVLIPEYFTFKPVAKGYLLLDPKYSTVQDQIRITSSERTGGTISQTNFSTDVVDYKIKKTSFDMTDVPALKEESYVNNINNYRSAIDYELQYVQFPRSELRDYTSSWEKVVKTIYSSPSFGRQLDFTNYYKDDLNSILTAATSDEEKIGGIFSYVQNRMNWNGYLGYSTDKGVKSAYKERTGNIADINLMLVSMLKNAGIKADPVLISTRNNGVPLFPTMEGFNYVIAMVELNGKAIFLDASNKYSGPNLLPTRTLNWFGRVIPENGASRSTSVFPSKPSPEVHTMNIRLNADGAIQGKCRTSHIGYNAYMFRNKYVKVSEDDYLEKLENENGGMEISNYKVVNKELLNKPIIESYDFSLENQANVVGDKIYFSPLFYNTTEENPFKLEKRNYPIDFTFPWQQRYTINISIPEGYKVTSKPEDVNLALQNNIGSFVYRIAQGEQQLNVIVELKMNLPIIPAQNYPEVKELYKKLVEKETEKVVLSKI